MVLQLIIEAPAGNFVRELHSVQPTGRSSVNQQRRSCRSLASIPAPNICKLARLSLPRQESSKQLPLAPSAAILATKDPSRAMQLQRPWQTAGPGRLLLARAPLVQKAYIPPGERNSAGEFCAH